MAVCDRYPGVGLCRAASPPRTRPPPPLPPPRSLAVASELTPDTRAFIAGHSSECRAGLLLLPLPFARTWLTRPLNTDRLRFTFPRRPRPLLRVSQKWCCAVRPTHMPQLFVLPWESSLSPCQNHTPRDFCKPHMRYKTRKKNPSLTWSRKKERKRDTIIKKKNTPFRASCCRELQKVLLLFVPKWLLLVTENTCLLLFGFRRRVPTC